MIHPSIGQRGSAEALIAVQTLSKVYPTVNGGYVHALDNVDIDIGEGEFVSIVGPSGCGKSTLLRIIAGLDVHDEGRLILAGRDIAGPSPDVGVVFQAANLLPWLTVRENVRLPLRVGGKKKQSGTSVDDLLAMTGLGEFGERYPYELSGGMQQRAGICRALARNPRILLMDEPFGALDALTRERMNLELQNIWQTHKKTVILITHSISEALFLGNRVIVMSARPGRIIADLKVDIPRPRSLDSIILHPEYARLSSEIRGLLNAQGEVE
ncbi:MAG: ABC transporter ATP-binding protein [Hyphomicrobiales bacterium]|nr:ABC transporter ATP-binding protein [Hyphomicrobiales bacterium]MDE2115287.1 ABC transporter ATP-binding protein [Hyphomicrobiales bacterium]